MRTDFAVIPGNEEIEKLERDLRFYPVQNANPAVLPAERLDEFNREGYLKPFRAFPTEQIAAIRSQFDELLERTIASGGDSYSIVSAHLKYPLAWDLLTNEVIVDHVSDLLGENVIGWGCHFFCKMPGDGKAVTWHQDASYWPLTPSKAVTVWLAIDDADRDNACMKFVAGSHHQGHLTYRPSQDQEGNVLDQTVEDAEQYGEVIYDELKAGEFSMHSDLLLHGSEENDSDRRRCGLTLRYCTPDVRASLEWNQKGVWARGSDASEHWSNRERPAA